MNPLVISDLHLVQEEPFHSAQINFLDNLNRNYSEHELILLGDAQDSSSPHGEDTDLLASFLKSRKKTTYYIHGNHEFKKYKGSSVKALRNINNVVMFLNVEEFQLDNYKCLALPYRYNESEMKAYEEITNTFDYVFTHITPRECAFNKESGIDLKLKAKCIFHGHTHTYKSFINKAGVENIVIGVPIPVRYPEICNPQIMINNGIIEYIEFPKYFEYKTIEYGDLPEDKQSIYNILNAPSVISVSNMYKDYYIREDGISIKDSDVIPDEDIKEILNSNDSLEKKYLTFVDVMKNEQDMDIPEEVVKMTLNYFDKVK